MAGNPKAFFTSAQTTSVMLTPSAFSVRKALSAPASPRRFYPALRLLPSL